MDFVLGLKPWFRVHDRSMISKLGWWRGDKEPQDFFESCWQDSSLGLAPFSYFSTAALNNSIMR